MFGLSLVELMVGMTLGLIVILGLTILFSNTNRTRTEMEKSGRLIENGRYALDLLSSHVKHAGFFDGYVGNQSVVPDPCSPGISDPGWTPVVVFDNAGATTPVDATLPTCLTGQLSGTDAITLRSVSSESWAVDTLPATGNTFYFQARKCVSDAAPFVLTQTVGELNLRDATCLGNPANILPARRYFRDTFFIGTFNNIPTLMKLELGSATPVPLVEGIENMQIVYDAATATVQISLLVRSTERSASLPVKSYVVGNETVTPSADFKRHVYSTSVVLRNPNS